MVLLSFPPDFYLKLFKNYDLFEGRKKWSAVEETVMLTDKQSNITYQNGYNFCLLNEYNI